MNLRTYFIAFLAIFFTIYVHAQVGSIKYLLKFNEKTNLFDAYFVVNEGQAVSHRDRAQFNAQYTILIPSGSNVEMVSSFNPIQANQQYTGNNPTQWVVANIVKKPEADPEHDYVSISPSLSPAAFYNNLMAGQEVKLFSLKITPIIDCGSSVKLFNNEKDLNSGARGMGGGDFSNGFTMGNTNQKYAGNETVAPPKADIFKEVNVSVSRGLQINTTTKPDALFGPYQYEISGPKSYYSKFASVNITNPSKENFGNYTLVAIDSRGCKDVRDVLVLNQNQPVKEVVKKSDESENSTSLAHLVENKAAHYDIAEINLYPNPATTNLIVNINAAKGAKVRGDILDITGRIINANVINKVTESKNEVLQLSVLDYDSGIYSLSMTINGKDIVKKFMVLK